MTEVKTNWVEHAFQVLSDWTLVAFPMGMWPDPIQWRMGKNTYMEMAEQIVGAPHEYLNELGPPFRALSDEVEKNRNQRLQSLTEAWGKEGTFLLGYPVICDEDFEGLTLEKIQ